MTEKKNILILPRWYPNKEDVQLGTFIQKQAILLKDDFNIYVIYVQADPNLKDKQELHEFKDKGIHERIVYFKGAKGPFKKLINARRYKLAQLVAFNFWDITIDLCHVHVPYRSAFLALNLQRKGIPFVITEHWSGHLTGEFQKKNATDKTIFKQVLGKAKKIATVSELLRDKFKENTGFDSEVIPNLIEVVDEESPRQKSDLIEILSVSDFIDSVKNITGLLMAFKLAHEQNPKLRLALIGGGPDENLVRDTVQNYKLDKVVNLAGRLAHEDVLKTYHHCDYYVCNSNFETFGMTVAEALLAGKPVISTNCGGPQEFINLTNGILIPTASNGDLSSSILKMAETFNNYDSMAIKTEIKHKFGAETIREKLCNFYNSAIND